MSEPCQTLKIKFTDILNDLVSMSAEVIKKSGLHLTEVETLDVISVDHVTNSIRNLLQRVNDNVACFTKTFDTAISNYKVESSKCSPRKKLNLSLKKNGDTQNTDVDLTNSDSDGGSSSIRPISTTTQGSQNSLLSKASLDQVKLLNESIQVKDEETASDSDSEKSIQNFDVTGAVRLSQEEGKTDGFVRALDELDKVTDANKPKEEVKEMDSRAESMSFDFDDFQESQTSPNLRQQIQRDNHELLDMLNKAMPDNQSHVRTEEEIDEALRILEDDASLMSVSDASVYSTSVNSDSGDEWMPSENESEYDGGLSGNESEVKEDEGYDLRPVNIDLRKRVDEMDDSEIDRLCDIHNINKRKCSATLHKHKKRKRKRIRLLSTSSSSSSSSDDTYGSTTPDLVIDTERPLSQDIQLGDVTALADQLMDVLDKEDEESNISSESDDTTDVEKKKKTDKVKDDEKKKYDSESDKEPEEEVIQPKKRGSWRNEINLWTSSESEDELVMVGNDEDDVEERILEEIKEDVKLKKLGDETLVITDSASEDDDDDVTFIDEVFSDDASGARGRRNIRAILDDNELNELTQRAKSEEDARIIRLEEHSKTMEKVQSQLDDLILDVDSKSGNPLITVDFSLSNLLKPHQREGVKFMWEACYESVEMLKTKPGTGCILAHCMGLGKTLQVIALVHTLFRYEVTRTKHVLIIAPLSTVNNWKNEFKQALKLVEEKENFRSYYIVKMNIYDKTETILAWRKNGGVLVLGYETFQILTNVNLASRVDSTQREKLCEALLDPGPDLIVCDEGHQLKNDKTLRTQALMKVRTKRRIVLTGTPLQNNLKEYYYMVQFVKPHLLGTYTEFTNRFATPIKNGQFHDSRPEDIKLMKKRTHVLTKLLKKTIHRVEASVLATYLPEIIDYTIFVKLTPVQIQIYEKYITEVMNRSSELGKGFLQDVMILNYNNLHPYTLELHYSKSKRKLKKKPTDLSNGNDIEFVESVNVGHDWYKTFLPSDFKTNANYSTKVSLILNIIDESTKLGEKVLIFAQNLVELDTLEHFLKVCGTGSFKQWTPEVDYYRMDGETPVENRDFLCKRFNTNQTAKVFLLTHKVGGLGLNLTGANRVIMIGSNHNPTLDTQSMYRVYRFGQNKKCYIYRLLSLATMEEKIYHRCVVKLILSGTVVDKLHFDRRYSASDLQEMYKVDFSGYAVERPIPVVPTDKMLAQLLQSVADIYKYHPHNSLLENRPEEELTDEDKKLAWDEFNSMEEAAKQVALAPIQAPTQVINPMRIPMYPANPSYPYNRFGQIVGIRSSTPNLVMNPLNNNTRGFIPRSNTGTQPRTFPRVLNRSSSVGSANQNQNQPRMTPFLPFDRDVPQTSGHNRGSDAQSPRIFQEKVNTNVASKTLEKFATALKQRQASTNSTEGPSGGGEFNYALNKVV